MAEGANLWCGARRVTRYCLVLHHDVGSPPGRAPARRNRPCSRAAAAGNGQVLALFLMQGVLIVGLSALLAPWLAWPLPQLIGRATTFMVFGNGRLLPATVEPSLYQYAGGGSRAGFDSISGPTLRAARQTSWDLPARSGARRAAVPRPSLLPWTWSLLRLAGGWGYRTLSQSGTIITAQRNRRPGVRPVIAAHRPIALTIALAFLALRLVPLAMRGLAHLMALTDTVAPLFALRQVARAPARYNGLILILTFTLALGLFTATVAGAFDRNYGDQARLRCRGDLRTHEFNYGPSAGRCAPGRVSGAARRGQGDARPAG